MAAQADRATTTWSTPECSFSIESSSRVLDDIRLAVTDAFFSLPRGGAEIGGVLLGEWQEGRLTISDYAALECEHAFGPSFTLSLKDEKRLMELIHAAGASGAGQVVGWYHSHTRTGVLLSDSDLTIHNKFFPESWQVALVVKPHTLEPMRAGFFFRGNGGIIHTSASYREFLIEPVPRGVSMEQPPPQPLYRPASAGAIVDVRAEPEARPAPVAPVIDVKVEPEAPPAPATPIIEVRAEPASQSQPAAAATVTPRASEPEAVPETSPIAPIAPVAPVQLPMSSLVEHRPERSGTLPKVLLAAGLVLAGGAAVYATHDLWLPGGAGPSHAAPPDIAGNSIGLNTVDEAGQLQIRWDPRSAPARAATGASLEIEDGDQPMNAVPLDVEHLAAGVFTYGRRNEKVDVTLVLDQPGGAKLREVTSFLGQKPPVPATPANAAQSRNAPPNQGNEELSRVVAGLRAQLDTAVENNRKLEKQLAIARAQLREQQLRRLNNQASPLEH
jgi:proteasome lid subunit RPN8/RPN11